MKTKGITFILLAALLAVSCGKKNETGKSANNRWGFNNPYGSPLMNQNGSNLSYGGVTLNQIMQYNPCISGYAGYGGMNSGYGGQRIPLQVPMSNFPGVVAPNDIYVGVTSYGDVGVVVGQAAGQPPMFLGYMCPRQFDPSGQGQLIDVKIGAYTQCLFKPITAAVVQFPGGATANFRMLDGGTSAGFASGSFQKFPFCR